MVNDTDPKACRLAQTKPLLMMMMVQSLMQMEEQAQADEDMDSNGPTVTLPPADLDLSDPLMHGHVDNTIEIMEITEECDDLTLMDVAEDWQIDEYREEDTMMVDMDHINDNNGNNKCRD